VTVFEGQAPDTSLMIEGGIGNLPRRVTARYPDVSYFDRASLGLLPKPPKSYNANDDSANLINVLEASPNRVPVYLALTDGIRRKTVLYGYQTRQGMREFEDALRASPAWRVIFEKGNAVLFEFIGTAATTN
jgi:hypothetical protein